MSKRSPLVSVVIPAYNRAHLLNDALESVFAQTFKDFEIVFVDDGSTDGTEELIRSKYTGRLRYIKQENRGISGARNRGIESAIGKYIAFLDSDDMWLPEKLAKQTAFMEAHPEVGMTCTRLHRYEVGKENEKQVCPDFFSPKFEDLLNSNNYIPTTTVMVRSEVFRRVGGFDRTLLVAEDFDLWLRIMNLYPCSMVEDILAEHRDHPRKTTRDLTKVYDGYWKFYAKTLKLYPRQIRDYKAFRDRGASFEYLLGAELLRKGKFNEAFRRILGSLQVSPAIGTYFGKSSKAGRLFLLIKPYAVLALSAVRAMGYALSWRIESLIDFCKQCVWGIVFFLSGFFSPVVCLSGVRVRISRGLSDSVKKFMIRGKYESEELSLLSRYLEVQDVVLEVGSGIGLTSAYCAKKIGSERVFTFDANAALEAEIKKNYELNGVCPKLEICVLADEDGETDFYVEKDHWKSSLVRQSPEAVRVRVPKRKLSRYLQAIKPSLLIVDIEGGEGTFFYLDEFKSVSKLLIEVHPEVLGALGIADLENRLHSLGFEVAEKSRLENVWLLKRKQLAE